MKKGVLIAIIIGSVLLVFVAGFIILTSGNNSPNGNTDPNQMVDCGKMTNPTCFSNRMTDCLPVTAEMTATDGTTRIDLTILGVENEKCHFQRKINNVLNMDCYFPTGSLNWDLIDQMFGNDKGMQSVIDSSCTNV